MSCSSVTKRPSAPVPTSCDQDDLLGKLQTTLAALADVEVQYEIHRERLQASTDSDSVKRRLSAELEMCHRAEREPHVRRLAELHHRMMTTMAFQDIVLTS